jgi:hypothetical protein
MAIGGNLDGDGGGVFGWHAFGPSLILLFSEVIAYLSLRIFCLFLLSRQFNAQFLDEHQDCRRHRKG